MTTLSSQWKTALDQSVAVDIRLPMGVNKKCWRSHVLDGVLLKPSFKMTYLPLSQQVGYQGQTGMKRRYRI